MQVHVISPSAALVDLTFFTIFAVVRKYPISYITIHECKNLILLYIILVGLLEERLGGLVLLMNC